MNEKILLLDDDFVYLQSLKKFLELHNYDVSVYDKPEKAIKNFQENNFDCALIDLRMPGKDGIKVLKQFKALKPEIPVIMISGAGTIALAVKALRVGAFDFIEKGEKPDHLLVVVRNALEKRQLEQEKTNLQEQLIESIPLIGQSRSFKKIMERLPTIAKSNAKILLTGETGTGKDLVARAIHIYSNRVSKPFVKLNCAAIPGSLLESELFGYKKGAFTGAQKDYQGKFLAADGGTLFLDEIGDMPPNLQAKLLRVLESGEVEVVGDTMPVKVDARIISATNKNLEQLVLTHQFREDLFHRLNVIHLHIPPLRERPEDIPVLFDYYLNFFSQSYNKAVPKIEKEVVQYLTSYSWPGNVRELKNFVEKLVVLSSQPTVTLEQVKLLFEPISDKNKEEILFLDDVPLKEAIENFEKHFITKSLQRHQFKVQETARSLGINRSALFRKMQKYGIQKKRIK